MNRIKQLELEKELLKKELETLDERIKKLETAKEYKFLLSKDEFHIMYSIFNSSDECRKLMYTKLCTNGSFNNNAGNKAVSYEKFEEFMDDTYNFLYREVTGE